MTSKTPLDIPELRKAFNLDNYKIINNSNNNNNIAIIYFSSNGIYFPNESNIFCEKILTEDRFEWQKNLLSSAKKIILVRDIKKQWYFNGINSKISTINQLYDFLSIETKNMTVTCVGNSAGGYAATLFGCLLKAERVFNFSGQFSLYPFLSNTLNRNQNPILANHTVGEFSKFISLINLINSNSVPIFYFYPFKHEADYQQSKLVKNNKNVFSFAFDTKGHAETCYPINFLDLFRYSNTDLFKLHKKLGASIIHPVHFSNNVSGLLKTLRFLTIQKLKHYIRSFINLSLP